MSTDLLIRSPQACELEFVRELVQTVVDEVYGGIWAESPLLIDEEDWSRALVAIDEMHIVGVVLTHEDWISDLWVLRESRGRGVGKTLLMKGESEAFARGFQTLRLRVVKSNTAAVSFYGRNGWRVNSEFHHEKLPVTMIEMSKTRASS